MPLFSFPCVSFLSIVGEQQPGWMKATAKEALTGIRPQSGPLHPLQTPSRSCPPAGFEAPLASGLVNLPVCVTAACCAAMCPAPCCLPVGGPPLSGLAMGPFYCTTFLLLALVVTLLPPAKQDKTSARPNAGLGTAFGSSPTTLTNSTPSCHTTLSQALQRQRSSRSPVIRLPTWFHNSTSHPCKN